MGVRILAWWVDKHDQPHQFVTDGDYYAHRYLYDGEWLYADSYVSWEEDSHGDTGWYVDT